MNPQKPAGIDAGESRTRREAPQQHYAPRPSGRSLTRPQDISAWLESRPSGGWN